MDFRNLFDKNKSLLLGLGVGVLAFLIIHHSTKKLPLQEVLINGGANQEPFDHSILPSSLQPPRRLSDGEPLPKTAKRSLSFNSLGIKPRFDR